MNTKSEMSEIRALTTDELDLVCGAATPVQFQVDLGNMKIGGYADGSGNSMGFASGGGMVVAVGITMGW
jgi:hypothetical protein